MIKFGTEQEKIRDELKSWRSCEELDRGPVVGLDHGDVGEETGEKAIRESRKANRKTPKGVLVVIGTSDVWSSSRNYAGHDEAVSLKKKKKIKQQHV